MENQVSKNDIDEETRKALLRYHTAGARHKFFRNFYEQQIKVVNWRTALFFSSNFRRLFDCSIAAFLVLLLSPLMLCLLCIHSLSRNLQFLKTEERVGKDGDYFALYQFCYLRIQKNKQWLFFEYEKKKILEKQPVKNDKSIKPLGDTRKKPLPLYYLWSWIPELFNVILGDMGLFGSRPLALEEAEKLSMEERKALQVRPGIWVFPSKEEVLSSSLSFFSRYRDLAKEYKESKKINRDLAILFALQVQIFLGRKSYE